MRLSEVNAISTSFRQRRHALGVSTGQMSFLLDMPYWTYYRYETGYSCITTEQVVIADAKFKTLENLKAKGLLPASIPEAAQSKKKG